MFKNKDGSYCIDLFDSNFNGNADKNYLLKIQKEKEEQERLEKKKEYLEELKKKQEKEFWNKHPNDGWLKFD